MDVPLWPPGNGSKGLEESKWKMPGGSGATLPRKDRMKTYQETSWDRSVNVFLEDFLESKPSTLLNSPSDPFRSPDKNHIRVPFL